MQRVVDMERQVMSIAMHIFERNRQSSRHFRTAKARMEASWKVCNNKQKRKVVRISPFFGIA